MRRIEWRDQLQHAFPLCATGAPSRFGVYRTVAGPSREDAGELVSSRTGLSERQWHALTIVSHAAPSGKFMRGARPWRRRRPSCRRVPQ